MLRDIDMPDDWVAPDGWTLNSASESDDNFVISIQRDPEQLRRYSNLFWAIKDAGFDPLRYMPKAVIIAAHDDWDELCRMIEREAEQAGLIQ